MGVYSLSLRAWCLLKSSAQLDTECRMGLYRVCVSLVMERGG